MAAQPIKGAKKMFQKKGNEPLTTTTAPAPDWDAFDIGFQVLRDGVLVLPKEAEEKSEGGLFIPEVAKEKPRSGIVLALGPGRMDAAGVVHPVDIPKGATVLYSRYGGSEIKIGDQVFILLKEEEILGYFTYGIKTPEEIGG